MDPLREAALRQGIVCGIDLGSKHDYTAIIVLEVEKRIKEGKAERLGFTDLPLEAREQILRNGEYLGHKVRIENHFAARYVKRLPLGISYPEVVRKLKKIDRELAELTGGEDVFYVVDATGFAPTGRRLLNLRAWTRSREVSLYNRGAGDALR